MATRRPDPQAVVEPCEQCGRETPHDVTIELVTEGSDAEHAAFSREPYRVTECRVCGASVAQRMNDA